MGDFKKGLQKMRGVWVEISECAFAQNSLFNTLESTKSEYGGAGHRRLGVHVRPSVIGQGAGVALGERPWRKPLMSSLSGYMWQEVPFKEKC